MKTWKRHALTILPLLILSAGCGKQQEQGGHMGAFPANAVVARVTPETVYDKVDLVATLASKEYVTLVSELDATLNEILFVEGQAVSEGAPLAYFDDTRTSAQLAEAKANAKLAALTYERGKELLKNQTISQEEFDQAEAEYYASEASLALAEEEHAKTRITAPFDGVVGENRISAGQFVTRNTEITELFQMDPLEIVIDVPERYLGSLVADMAVRFRADALPGETFSGKVAYIAPSINDRTRSIRVKADVPNPDHKLKPGMFGRLDLVLSKKDDALVIPESSIQFKGNGTMVIIVNAAGLSEFRVVQVGLRFDSRAEIVNGLSKGDIVVVEGWQKMGPGMPVIATAGSAAYGVEPGPLGSPADAPPGEGVSHGQL